MKKLLSAFSLCLALVAAILLTGCGDPEIVSGKVKAGTLTTTVVKDEAVITSDVVAVFTYDDKTTLDVVANDLSFSVVDTSTTGEKTLTITYDGFSFSVTITVVASEADINKITTFESKLLTDYNYNKGVKTNAKEEFVNKNLTLVVGDDNKVDFRIKADATANGTIVLDVKKVRTDITIKRKVNNDYLLLINDLATYASIDTEYSYVDFTQEAVGSEFEITVQAVNFDPIFLTQDQASFTIKVKVVDGYNVYTPQELSVYDNVETQKWATLKQNWHLDTVQAKNVVLLSNIELKDEYIPASHFWTESTPGYAEMQAKTNLPLKGSLIDNVWGDVGSVYERAVEDDTDFNFYGNYFTVDSSKISKSVVDSEGHAIIVEDDDHDTQAYITTHTCLFRLSAFTNGEINKHSQGKPSLGKGTFDTVGFIGNGPRTDLSQYSGGIILCKATAVNFTAQNTLYKNFFIGYFTEYGLSVDPERASALNVIKDTKGYNNYNTHLYAWGTENVLIENCTLLSCGGPVIISDHTSGLNYDKTTGAGGFPTHINAINSTLVSYISGSEPWFVTYGASEQVASLKIANVLYNGTYSSSGLASGKSIVKNYDNETPSDTSDDTPNAMNLIIVYKNGSAKGITTDINRGYMRIFDTRAQYEAYYDETNPVKNTFGLDLGTTTFGDGSVCPQKALTNSSVYFESSGNGGYVNQGVATNHDSTALHGTVNATTIYTILKNISSSFVSSSFETSTLANQKLYLCGCVNSLPHADALNALYTNAITYGAISAITDWDIMEVAEKQAALVSIINAFENTSYTEGKYVNIYLPAGIAAMCELFTVA